MKLATIIAVAAATSLLAADPALINTNHLTRAGNTVRLPGLVIHDTTPPRIEATGKIANTNGLLEFIAVEPKGRDYESLLTLDCKPSALQFALLLIGCETGTVHNARSHLLIEVEYKNKRLPVEHWLLERKTQKPPAALRWIFNGSHFAKNPVTEEPVFLADAEQAHIALWEQPSIPINLATPAGNPYKGDDQGFDINAATVPPAGTPVTLILRAAKP